MEIKEVEKEKVTTTVVVESYKGEGYDTKIRFKTPNNYSMNIMIIRHPTQNCQISSIGLAQNIRLIINEDIKKFIEVLQRNTCSQILVDVHNRYMRELNKVLEPYLDVVFKQPYKSTNGSEMTMMLLKWKGNCGKYETDIDEIEDAVRDIFNTPAQQRAAVTQPITISNNGTGGPGIWEQIRTGNTTSVRGNAVSNTGNSNICSDGSFMW